MKTICVLNMTNEQFAREELPDADEYYEVHIGVEPDNLTLAEAKREVAAMLTALSRIDKFDILTAVYLIVKPNRNDLAMVLFAVSALSTIQILPKIWVLNGRKGVYMDVSDFVVDGSIHLLKDWKKNG
jgi:hypothetical protein